MAAIGAFTLRDQLTFQALADNREARIAFRDVKTNPEVPDATFRFTPPDVQAK